MFKPVRTFIVLPLRQKLWFVLLFPLSGLCRCMILTLPFARYAWLLGERRGNDQLLLLAQPQAEQLAWRIGRIIEQVGRFTPWESKCLVQAILARAMCRWYGLPYVLHLGVARNQDIGNPLQAHAWVSVGRWVIVGRDGHKAFTIVSTYVAPRILCSAQYPDA